MEKLLAAKGTSFEEGVIRRVSVAAAPLAAWVRANLAFRQVAFRWGVRETYVAV